MEVNMATIDSIMRMIKMAEGMEEREKDGSGTDHVSSYSRKGEKREAYKILGHALI